MTSWETRIIDAFIKRYFSSAAAAEAAGRDRAFLRLRSSAIFPDFETSSPDDRESYLEAAEALENQGLLVLTWVKRRKGELLSTLVCSNTELLFTIAGRASPKTIVGEAREAARGIRRPSVFFAFLSEHINSADTVRDIDAASVLELARLTEALETRGAEQMTTRSLSIELYGDSKRLEHLLDSFSPLFEKAQRQGIAIPDFAFLVRSFPETMIAGRIILEYDPGCAENQTPLVNAAGIILGLPLGSVRRIRRIRTLRDREHPTVLMIENKETFYALGDDPQQYDCCLYTAGYPNPAVSALVQILSNSGFVFYHAGDLDPDGILILQKLREIAGKEVVPVRMDAPTFDKYLPWGRTLERTVIQKLEYIHEEVRAIPAMEGLIRRIKETGKGIEQEIIDYRPIISRQAFSSNG
ncbi:hypothetical protein AGMMS49944_00310 [Spirochaetia bacterium]|nr:hypothetical protein AGMMS49944_00310 [Spirochaetia bacterium]